MKPIAKVNGNANMLNQDQERMRSEVVDLELKARYWKAQFDIRYYTLEAERVQEPYNAYLGEQKKKNEELQKQFEESLAKMEQEGLKIARATDTDVDDISKALRNGD